MRLSFGRGGPRVSVGIVGALILLPVYLALWLVVAVVWVLAGVGMLLGTLIGAAVDGRNKRRVR